MADINLGLVAAIVIKETPPIHTEVLWGKILDPMFPTIVQLHYYKNAQWVPLLDAFLDRVPWKESILHEQQLLNGANGGIRPGGVMWLLNQPADGDVFKLASTAGPVETYTFKNTPVVSTDIEIGVDVETTMANMVGVINSESGFAGAINTSNMQALNPTGKTVVVYGQTTSDILLRMYGVFATPGDAQFVDYTGEDTYDKMAPVQLPATDNGKNFGFNKTISLIKPLSTHKEREGKAQYFWDIDQQIWVKIVPFTALDKQRLEGYRHVQAVAATVWTVVHNLQKRPNGQSFDSSGRKIEGDIKHVDDNNVTIEFSSAVAGEAYFT